MQAQAITNLLRVDAASGEAMIGQTQLTRLTNTRGNTLVTRAAHADARGNVYQLQAAGYAIADMANLTISGQPLSAPCDATVLLVSTPGLARLHWTHFARQGSPGDGRDAAPSDIDVRGEVVAALLATSADAVQVNALPGSRANVNGSAVAYLVVMPTVPADA